MTGYALIIDCSDEQYWYKNKIGEVYKLSSIGDETSIVDVKENTKQSSLLIINSDCIIFKEDDYELAQELIRKTNKKLYKLSYNKNQKLKDKVPKLKDSLYNKKDSLR